MWKTGERERRRREAERKKAAEMEVLKEEKKKAEKESTRMVEETVKRADEESRRRLEETVQKAVAKVEEECKRKIEDAEEKEVEREAARITERAKWEDEMYWREREVERTRMEWEDWVKHMEAVAKQLAEQEEAVVRMRGGQMWQIRERARVKARVAEEQWGEERRWYEMVEAYVEGWMEGKAEREQEEE